MPPAVTARALEQFPIHLGSGGSAAPQPAFPPDERAMQWYADYTARTEGDGVEGRLVSLFRFAENWTSWEMHPAGAEVVICTAGRIVLHQQRPDGTVDSSVLEPGDYAINPPGVWHTADTDGEAAALFITPGVGTQHRPR